MYPSDVNRSPQFERELNQLRAIEPRIDSVVDGIVWAIQRKPDFGTLVDSGKQIYAIAGADVLKTPIKCFYSFHIAHAFLKIALLSIVTESE